MGPRHDGIVLPRQKGILTKCGRSYVKSSIQNTHTHQLLQYGAAQLIFQGPGIWSGSKVRQYPPCKVANPHIHLRVLQEAENVLQNVLLHQISLQLLHLSNVVLQFKETNYSSDCKNII